MAQGTTKATGAGKPAATSAGTPPGTNTAVFTPDHDRVAMLTLNADGTPNQINPEMIGDPDAAKAATAEQFRQQAVSAEDVRLRGVVAPGGAGETVEQDPSIKVLQDAHEKVADAATKAAEAAVDALHTGESEKVPDTNPAATTS